MLQPDFYTIVTKMEGIRHYRLVLQAEFYIFVTKMGGAGFYPIDDSVATSFLHYCHKNGRSWVLSTRG